MSTRSWYWAILAAGCSIIAARADGPCDADLDGSGAVNSTDLNVILASFANSDAGDVNGDGQTTSQDLNLMLAAFGTVGCGAGDCCAANAWPGCGDEPCQEVVCAAEPFCCAVVWDGLCAVAAATGCGDLCPGFPFAGDCCTPNGSPGCEEAECLLAVCDLAPYCCDEVWDHSCADLAEVDCPECARTGSNCCVAHFFPGCDNPVCEEDICIIDSYCCDVEWDTECEYLALSFCDICG